MIKKYVVFLLGGGVFAVARAWSAVLGDCDDALSLGGQAPVDTVLSASEYYSSESSAGTYRYDYFDKPQEDVHGVRWWGGAVSPGTDENCATTEPDFLIRFFKDDSGNPGDEIASFSVSPTLANQGNAPAGFLRYEYVAFFDEPARLEGGWISIATEESAGCEFMWYAGEGGDGKHLLEESGKLDAATGDLSFCLLRAPMGEGEGAGEGEGEGDGGVMDVPLVPCPEGSIGGQPPMDPAVLGFSAASDASTFSERIESFSGISEAIGGLTWWGFELNGISQDCARVQNSFRVRFYSDDNGSPGGLADEFNVTATRTFTGIFVGLGEFELKRYEVTFDRPVMMDSGWLSIVGTNSTSCAFAWYVGAGGDDRHFKAQIGGDPVEDNFGIDLSYCFMPYEGEGEGGTMGLPECPEGVLAGQRPFTTGNPFADLVRSDGGGSSRFERFSGVLEPIGGVSWYGSGETSGGGHCALEDTPDFFIRFYEDDSGAPGALREEFELRVTDADSGLDAGLFSLIRYEAALPEPVMMGSGWISIGANIGPPCSFAWLRGLGGDLEHYRTGPDSTVLVANDAIDLNYCLYPAGVIMAPEGEPEGDGEGGINPVLIFEDCPVESATGQSPAEIQTADSFGYPSDGALQLESYDRFMGAGIIGGMRWYGVEKDDGDVACDRSSDAFRIRFYEDGVGFFEPGDLYAQRNVTASGVDAGTQVDGVPLKRYEVTFDSPVDLNAGWVSIVGQGDSDCHFYWYGSPEGNNLHFFADLQGSATSRIGDLSYCLYPWDGEGELPEGEMLEGEGAGVELFPCPEGSVFGQPPANFGTAAINLLTSDEGIPLTRFEYFSGVMDAFQVVRWWGTDFDALANACVRDPQWFRVSIWSGPSNTPEAMVSETVVEATVLDTGVSFQGKGIYEYTAVLPAAVDMESGWLGIAGAVDETCRFAWLTSAVGAGGHESTDGSGTFSPRSGELSLCLLPPGAALEGELPEEAHSADVDGNNIVSFSEMLRVIQLYNAAVFGCASGSEDGFAPASLMRTCPRHAADYAPQDWRLNLAELLRVVQIYNAGGYTYCVTSEDGFCPSQL